MRAALYRDMGDAAEGFCVEEVERPEPGPGEVLVRVHASGVNPTDYKARSGAVPRPIDDYQIPHQDGAGVIEAVGAGGGGGWAVGAAGGPPLRDRRRVDHGARAAGGDAAGRSLVRTGCLAGR